MIDTVKKEFKRRIIDEGLSRTVKCVGELSDEQLWYKHNSNTNSIGNIILHLCGNVRQYIQTGIGKQEDIRNRPLEFLLSSRVDRKILIGKILDVVNEANAVIQNLTESELNEDREVQGFDENVLSIIIHVIEHFSYHVGQITFFTKFVNDLDTGYYAGLDLDVTG